MVADELDMNKETVRKILVQDLGIRKLAVKLMPRNLMEEQKETSHFVEQLQEDNFLDRVIIGDETRCYQYDPEAKHQSMECRLKNFPGPKKPWMSKSKFKTMLTCFFDIWGIIHFEFVPKGTTANETFYVEVLKRLIDFMRHKRGELWKDCSLILHHETMPAYPSLRCCSF
jgi:hypothetical protein